MHGRNYIFRQHFACWYVAYSFCFTNFYFMNFYTNVNNIVACLKSSNKLLAVKDKINYYIGIFLAINEECEVYFNINYISIFFISLKLFYAYMHCIPI